MLLQWLPFSHAHTRLVLVPSVKREVLQVVARNWASHLILSCFRMIALVGYTAETWVGLGLVGMSVVVVGAFVTVLVAAAVVRLGLARSYYGLAGLSELRERLWPQNLLLEIQWGVRAVEVAEAELERLRSCSQAVLAASFAFRRHLRAYHFYSGPSSINHISMW